MSIIHYTWFGPPAAAKKESLAAGVGEIWPDISGPIKMALQLTKQHSDVRIFFWCLEEHVEVFARDLTQVGIEVKSIEAALGGINVTMQRPVPDQYALDKSVKYIITKSLERTGNGYNIRKLVNAKNIWSLWCMYEYGGYHMDTGVCPNDGLVSFPDPPTFQVPCIADPARVQGVQPRQHCYMRWPDFFGYNHSTLIDENFILEMIVFPLAERENLAQSQLKLPFDVWLLRSPRRHPVARKTLEWYIHAWCRITDLAQPGKALAVAELYKNASRVIIMSAVATGISHSGGEGEGCGDEARCRSHLLATRDVTNIDTLGVRKLGFRSHG